MKAGTVTEPLLKKIQNLFLKNQILLVLTLYKLHNLYWFIIKRLWILQVIRLFSLNTVYFSIYSLACSISLWYIVNRLERHTCYATPDPDDRIEIDIIN